MHVSIGRKLLLWLLFFLICMGLGYPTLNRYDPRSVPGLSDSIGYASLVTGGHQAGDEAHRVLVPYLARPIYWLVNGHLHSWNPVFFALLFVNSFFIASTAQMLVGIANRIAGNYEVALISGFLYLVNFAVPNFNLSAYVDSAVNCIMIGVAWALLTERWWLLPLWAAVGALAKETSIPLSAVFAFAWWIANRRRATHKSIQLAWIGGMIVAGFAALMLLMSQVSPGSTPLTFAGSRWDEGGVQNLYLASLAGSLFAPESFYVFGWLLPLGVWRLGRLPRPWVIASASAAFAALAMGVYDCAGSNTVRAFFSTLGPMLSLSAAILLSDLGKRSAGSESRLK